MRPLKTCLAEKREQKRVFPIIAPKLSTHITYSSPNHCNYAIIGSKFLWGYNGKDPKNDLVKVFLGLACDCVVLILVTHTSCFSTYWERMTEISKKCCIKKPPIERSEEHKMFSMKRKKLRKIRLEDVCNSNKF